MELYNVTLFVHIMGAVVLLSYGIVFPLMAKGLRGTEAISAFRTWAGVMSTYSKMGPVAAVFVLLSGLYMTYAEWSFTQAWIIVSLVLFILSGAIAGGVLDKHLAKLLEAAQAAPEGPVPAELRAEAASPRFSTFESLLFGFDLAIVYMMTNKPGLVGALTATAAGLVVAGVLIARRSRALQAAAQPA